MKPNTRRIWIFVGLKAKEVGIVLAWIVGSASLLFGVWLFHFMVLHQGIGEAIGYVILNIILFALGCLACFLIFALLYALYKTIKKWIKSNWRKAGQIEKRTRKK